MRCDAARAIGSAPDGAEGTEGKRRVRPWFSWRGRRYEGVTALDSAGRESHIIACPQCGNGVVFDDRVHRDEMWLPHAVQIAADGAMSVTPSVVCPYKCGWHVVIGGGIAV